MRTLILCAFFSALINSAACAQQIDLKGVIEVWNNRGSRLTLIDDYNYVFCPGDQVDVVITGNANLAPRDEERKGGGFLGLFKKRYTVRIDNVLAANDASFDISVNDEHVILSNSGNAKTGTLNFAFSQGGNDSDLTTQYKDVFGYITSSMTPLRQGSYDILLKINSANRLDKLRSYIHFIASNKIDFSKDIKPYVENGRLIYRCPEKVVEIVEDELKNAPNIANVKKELYKYLINFAPNNNNVRSKLAEAYLDEMNFSRAHKEAITVIKNLNAQASIRTLGPKDFGAYAVSYNTLAGVDAMKELGTQEKAYWLAANYYAEAASMFTKSEDANSASLAIIKEVRCLQKVGDLDALRQALLAVKKQEATLR